MPPFRTSVVHICEFRKEEFLDRHESHAPQVASKRPFLCVLSPDTLQLVTAGDASDGPAPRVSASLLKIATGKPDRGAGRPLSLLHKLAQVPPRPSSPLLGGFRSSTTEEGSGGAGNGSGDGGAAPDSGRRSRAGEEDFDLGGELEEGQLLRLTIALSQVASIERHERRIKILFHRQKPHRSTESSDDWKAVMKTAVLPFALPFEAYKHRNWEVGAYLNRHRRDPFLSSVVLEADSAQEAEVLHAGIQEAIARLAQAVQWLSQDLPLQCRPVVTLVTAASAAAGSTADASAALASPAASPVQAEGLGPAAVAAASQRIVASFPRLKQPLEIPILGVPGQDGVALETAGGKRAELAASEAEQDAELADELAVHVWLHSPLGPSVATITTEQLQRSAAAGGAPLVVVATPHEDPAAAAAAAAEAAAPNGNSKLEVVLQFKAERHAAFPAARRLASLRSRSRTDSGPPSSGSGSSARGALAAGGGSAGSSALPAILAVLCVPLLAAWLQLVLHRGAGDATTSVLTSVTFLVNSLAALVAIVVVQLKCRPASPPEQSCAPALLRWLQAAPPPAGWWRLTLLHVELVQESQRAAACAPAVRRIVSASSLPTAPSAGGALRLDGSAPELPPHIRRLVAEHPAVLTDDTASRFLVGLGSADKAYQGLKNMVEWVEAQGVADLVTQPQPHFVLIKQHYPQVFYCWSTRSDCVLEVECTGRWRQAFDALKALGVSDRALLRHQFFCMEYAFKVLDTRPLPQGKTVKIIDLEGLSMRDVSSSAFKWYLQVGGALLAVNYPQRLHKAFLLNAPAWSGVIWKVLAAVIPRRTREQLMLFTKKQKEAAAEALLQWVPAEQLPMQYGGKCAVPLGESDLEQEMARYVAQLNSGAGSSGGGSSGGAGSATGGLGDSPAAADAAAAVVE
ncbi:hypothetical protein ABPG75_000726 [Micractinium tetrahymenae]